MFKINWKDNKTRVILFLMITGWIRVLMIVIPGIVIYMNTQDYRANDYQEQSINKLNDYISPVKMEQRN